MNSQIKDNVLQIFLEGKIDSTNAQAIESEISKIVSAHAGLSLTFDASGLSYISSAGLRILLKYAKQSGQKLPIQNVSKEVYEIFEVTGFIEIFNVEKALRSISVEGCELLGKGGNGSVYRLDDDKIVKVYKPWMKKEDIDRERAFARNAVINGVPSVIAYDLVRCNDCFGVVFEMINSKTLGATIQEYPNRIDEFVEKYVALAKQLHSIHATKGMFTSIKDLLRTRVPKIAPWTSQEERDLLYSLIDCIPESDTLLHNDLHPGNIMIQDDELVLIDMPEMTTGPSTLDLVSIFRDLIVATQNPTNHIEQSVGIDASLSQKVGNLFFLKYKGFSDASELESYYKQLWLPFALNVVLIVGTESEESTKRAPMLMDKLLRGAILPNEPALRQALQNIT
ncbi:MAG: anti-sigma factor antagonist [Fibrobacter sp.]|nr:anti-sigma factor antagonist [Fibrobacter sp.]